MIINKKFYLKTGKPIIINGSFQFDFIFGLTSITLSYLNRLNMFNFADYFGITLEINK